MIRLYCRRKHTQGELCTDCAGLLAYAHARLDRCRFGGRKPSCRACKVHCYRPDMAARIREVMRFSGPRMIWTHPLLTLCHLLKI